ncbi:MetQ/NlpA family ABC transporter substrate-binding protein [Fastidiosibacter lacustris]|uniref:MetQ/NlpA family ABC transporter substrate-binding protein n=1 Tax=Fastidiosibacter lacustris TaxID=2056695 RepID=UPI000E353074|nr:MetQ/NlpA family ABC transporter substrate-binding protein [Fastidiosibacter lacustris]
MLQSMLSSLALATWQTIYMVFIATAIAIIGGLILGVLLYLSHNKQNLSIRLFNQVIGFIVNITRSIPYIILLILLYPITKIIVGTTIGTTASIVPLAIAALPFYARLTESAISEVDKGLIEAANAMGATKLQIIFKVLLPEAKTLLVDSATLTTIGLIGYSAMAGIVGGGGLGDLTYFQGYNNGNYFLLYGGVILLIVLVQLCQSYGNYLTNTKKLTSMWVLAGILVLASIAQIGYNAYQDTQNKNIITVGYAQSSEQQKVMEMAQQVAKNEYGLNVKLVSFGDYNLPNRALNNGDIDANVFQHIPFLENQIKEFGYKLTEIGKTFIYPMGVFSIKINSLKEVPMGAKVAIPNDPTNRGRALMILADAGLIQLKTRASWKATLSDITDNPYKLQIIPLQADQIPNNLSSVTLAVINNDFLPKANLTLKQALFVESKDSPFANIIVIRDNNKNNPLLRKFIQAYQSPQVKKLAEKLYPDDAAIPAW